jgi:hypothetical protein
MSCFSLAWIEQLLVWLIIVCAVVAILRLIIPWVAGFLGVPVITQVLEIVLWAFIAILAVWIVFALLGCLTGGSFGLLPPMPHR